MSEHPNVHINYYVQYVIRRYQKHFFHFTIVPLSLKKLYWKTWLLSSSKSPTLFHGLCLILQLSPLYVNCAGLHLPLGPCGWVPRVPSCGEVAPEAWFFINNFFFCSTCSLLYFFLKPVVEVGGSEVWSMSRGSRAHTLDPRISAVFQL